MKAKSLDELTPRCGNAQQIRIGLHSVDENAALRVGLADDVASVDDPLDLEHEKGRPLKACIRWGLIELEQKVHLEIGELIVRESQVRLVESKGLSVDLSSVRSAMAVRTQGNQILVFVCLTSLPRNYVVDVHLDVTAGRDCTTVTSLDENAALDFGGNCRARIVHKR